LADIHPENSVPSGEFHPSLPAIPFSQFPEQDLSRADRTQRHKARLAGSWEIDFPDAADDVQTSSTAWHLGQAIVSAGIYPRRRVVRSASMVRADPTDHYYVELRTDGDTRIEADGHCIVARPGEVVVLDMTRPVIVEAPAGNSIQFFMPRATFDALLPDMRTIHGTKLAGALSRLLSDHLVSIGSRLHGVTSAEAEGLARSTMQLVAACLTATPAIHEEGPSLDDALLRRASRYVEDSLDNPELGASDIGGALRVSRSTLYRLFQRLGGVANHIRDRRLVRAHATICEAGNMRSHAAIAEAHGFKSAAHFSRAFLARFGYRPSEAIRRVKPARMPASGTSRTDSLLGWLRDLRSAARGRTSFA
jgi:AraC-like DNA-binding protein